MELIIDLDEQAAIQDFGSLSPAEPLECKSQDTPRLDLYFAQDGNNADLGSSPGLRFGVFTTGNPNSLCTSATFTRNLDPANNVRYSGFPNFNTAAMAAAIGTSQQISVVGEVRYQVADGTIARVMDVPVTVIRSLLAETILDTTQAAFTVPAVAANVTIQITNTAWLKAGQNLTIGNGAGAYQVVSITDSAHFVAQNQGGTGNASPGTVIPSGSSVGTAPSPALPTYPDPSALELLVHKGVANGYASLDANTLLLASRVPVDGQTIVANAAGKIATSGVLATVQANFTTPAVNANVSVTVDSTSNLKANSYVRIPIAGYYIVQSITSGTVVVLQNNGDPFNATSGTTITTGTVLLPAQAAAGGGGTAGQNAFTTTTANFTVPAVGSTVSVSMVSTAWLAGSGYVLFINGAGYYAVSSITSSTAAILTNLGYAATNAAPGATISSGAQISPGALQGPASTSTGANAYDTTQASFTMPAAAASVNVTITNTGWLGVGQEVYIAGAGYFSVASITSPTVFSATNSNYPGAATPGSTIATGKSVSPAGVIGPQGAGGAGVNAFTTLTSNFTQPISGATVAIVVGTTAWMAPSQTIYITGGGYYTVTTITDLTHVTVTNLGYIGNAAPAATVTGSGTQAVTPAGVIGTAGAGAYTTVSSSFTVPAALQSVSVTVASTAALLQNQNIYIGTAGYFSVSTITDSTHLVAINLGSPGNVSSGTVIGSGVGVTPAGATGPAINTSGGFSTAADAIAPAGTGEVSHIASQTGGVLALKKLKSGPAGSVALTDQGGTTGDILVDVPVDGTTITVSGGKLTAAGGGGAQNPNTGVSFYDDFIRANISTTDLFYGISTLGIPGVFNTSTYGLDTTKKIVGSLEISTGNAASNVGHYFSYGGNSLGPGNWQCLTYGLGALVWKTRVFIEGTLPGTGIGYLFRTGIGTSAGGNYGTAALSAILNGFHFVYSPDNNSGQWFIQYGGASLSSSNTTVAVAGDTAYDLEFDVNTAWTQITAYINGTLVATISSGIPTTGGSPFWSLFRSSTNTTNFKAAVDFWSLSYTLTR